MACKRPRSPAIGLPLIADERLDHLLEQLAEVSGGSSVAVAIRAAQAAAHSGDDAEAGRLAAPALDAAWTALHTGHWTRVDTHWRSAYMVAGLFTARASASIGDASAGLRIVDLALMLGNHSFREPLLRAADAFEEALASAGQEDSNVGSDASIAPPLATIDTAPWPHRRRLSGTLPPLRRLRLPSLAYFYNECMVAETPVILTGVLDGWPALSSRPWSDLSYLRRCVGHRTVPVEVGAHYLDESLHRMVLIFVLILVNFVEFPLFGLSFSF